MNQIYKDNEGRGEGKGRRGGGGVFWKGGGIKRQRWRRRRREIPDIGYMTLDKDAEKKVADYILHLLFQLLGPNSLDV